MTATINPHVVQLADVSDLIELHRGQCLYLKPIARANITVTLPTLKTAGQSISNWDLMERLKKLVRPVNFESIRVTKSTIEFVRFEADVDNRTTLKKVLKILDGTSLKVIGFFETLRVKCGEAKSDCPTRTEWDTYFSQSDKMNEIHAGERPDTVYMAQMPCNWFQDLRKPNANSLVPSDFVLRRVFETFGAVRSTDIPALDEYRKGMSKTGIRQAMSGVGIDVTFEAYVQFVEYISFARCMDTLRGMKLVHVHADTGRAAATNILVDFDRTKHLSDKSIRKRRIEREKLVQIETLQREEATAKAVMAKAAAETEAARQMNRRTQREERRRLKTIDKRREQEQMDIERRIALEERALLVAQRKLQSIRILTHVLKRIQIKRATQQMASVEADLVAAVMRDAKIKKLRETIKNDNEEKERRETRERERRRDQRPDYPRYEPQRETRSFTRRPNPPPSSYQQQRHQRRGTEQPLPVVRMEYKPEPQVGDFKIEQGGRSRSTRDEERSTAKKSKKKRTSRSPRTSKRRRRTRSSSGSLVEEIVYEYEDGTRETELRRLNKRKQTQNIILQQRLAEIEQDGDDVEFD